MPLSWIQACKKYACDYNKGQYVVPKKGTAAYKKVKEIMGSSCSAPKKGKVKCPKKGGAKCAMPRKRKAAVKKVAAPKRKAPAKKKVGDVPAGYICNPATGRLVKKSGVLGKQILKGKVPKKTTKKAGAKKETWGKVWEPSSARPLTTEQVDEVYRDIPYWGNIKQEGPAWA